MSDDPYAFRRKLTFEQAEGFTPIPTQLALREVSDQLCSLLWLVVFQHIRSATHWSSMGGSSWLGDPWKSITQDYHVLHEYHMVDDYNGNGQFQLEKAKSIFKEKQYQKIFSFIQFVLRHPKCPNTFYPEIEKALVVGKAAYRVVFCDTIVPISSELETQTLIQAMDDLKANELNGSKGHLRRSAEALMAGDFSDSVTESINAVESVARILESTGTFSGALTRLQRSAYIHPALSQGFQKIYGYTSDEAGLRHPLLEDPSKVDEADALFMIGACASFISYIVNKSRASGLLRKK